MKKIAILDYGIGNLLSIKRSIEQYPVAADIIHEPDQMHSFDAVILPGVGAFKDGMIELTKNNFIHAINAFVTQNKPLLGICLGMQLLFEYSEEFGHYPGLGLVEGGVVKLPSLTINNVPQRIPHVGWSQVLPLQDSLFSALPSNREYYFCHSYAAKPISQKIIIANYQYGGHNITAAIKQNNIYGFQFHPEKSARAGLVLIEKFLQETNLI